MLHPAPHAPTNKNLSAARARSQRHRAPATSRLTMGMHLSSLLFLPCSIPSLRPVQGRLLAPCIPTLHPAPWGAGRSQRGREDSWQGQQWANCVQPCLLGFHSHKKLDSHLAENRRMRTQPLVGKLPASPCAAEKGPRLAPHH